MGRPNKIRKFTYKNARGRVGDVRNGEWVHVDLLCGEEHREDVLATLRKYIVAAQEATSFKCGDRCRIHIAGVYARSRGKKYKLSDVADAAHALRGVAKFHVWEPMSGSPSLWCNL